MIVYLEEKIISKKLILIFRNTGVDMMPETDENHKNFIVRIEYREQKRTEL